MTAPALTIPTAERASICRRRGVRALWLFGSAAASPADPRSLRPESDLDFLVEFEPGIRRGLADAYFGLRDDFARRFRRPIDLVTVGAVRNPYFAASLQATKVPVYAAA